MIHKPSQGVGSGGTMRQMGSTEIVASGSRKRYQGGNHVQSRRRQEVDEAVRDMLVCTM